MQSARTRVPSRNRMSSDAIGGHQMQSARTRVPSRNRMSSDAIGGHQMQSARTRVPSRKSTPVALISCAKYRSVS